MTSAKSIHVPISQPLQLGEVYNQSRPISLWPKLLGGKQVLFPNSPETGRTETRAAAAGLLLRLQRLSQKTVEPGDDQGEIRFWCLFFLHWIRPLLRPKLPPKTFSSMIQQIPFILKLV